MQEHAETLLFLQKQSAIPPTVGKQNSYSVFHNSTGYKGTLDTNAIALKNDAGYHQRS
jgi:hypothetical protein